jgi:hypothetical protein
VANELDVRAVWGVDGLHPEADFASEIVVHDLASGDERVVVPLGIAVEHPEWSPDSSSLIFNASDWAPEAGTIQTLDLDAPEAEPVVLLDTRTKRPDDGKTDPPSFGSRC